MRIVLGHNLFTTDSLYHCWEDRAISGYLIGECIETVGYIWMALPSIHVLGLCLQYALLWAKDKH